jgi:hypothetical protein
VGKKREIAGKYPSRLGNNFLYQYVVNNKKISANISVFKAQADHCKPLTENGKWKTKPVLSLL